MKVEWPYTADAIEAEYIRRRDTLGWRFLTCPSRNIETADVALIAINPGGRQYEPPKWSVEGGSAYLIESWKGLPPGRERLQHQILRMFEIMDIAPENVLSGYLVPFRSATWDELPNREEAKQFGKSIWKAMLNRANRSKVIVFGKNIGGDVAELLGAVDRRAMSAGWGEQTIETWRYGGSSSLVVLPHLSRFSLFNRPESEQAFLKTMQRHLDGPHSGGP